MIHFVDKSLAKRCLNVHPKRSGPTEVLLAVALQGALIGTLIMGMEKLPRGEWNDALLSLAQTKTFQGFLALCIVFHHCAQKVFFDRWRTAFSPSGLEVMALIGFAFVGYFFFCLGYAPQSCQRKRDYLDASPALPFKQATRMLWGRRSPCDEICLHVEFGQH